MTEAIIMILSGLGALFILIASIGFIRMPDFYLRVSVTTKAVTLGIGLILGGAALYFSEVSVVSRVFAIILFLLLTAPVAAHMIGRTAYFIGTKMWDKSVIDELEGMYKTETHELKSQSDEKGTDDKGEVGSTK
ncbi:monovalent cation/H(+) antiporter subunit G [Aridibaculum aurantiacum]|uniref:monovalent cation/H(+) antiporter subunit G n=1 Tax=Aridibaculum aurantiacum TaxID=2810307 RepID=UPI001A96A548|nr:monovalent cation/H(+) antiporter subunit G [Aridibaculum aurantiacum]